MSNTLRFQLFRAKDRAGKLYPKWRIKFLEGRRYLEAAIGYTDKGRTEQKAKDRLREIEHARHLAEIGIQAVIKKPLLELLEQYLDNLARKGGRHGHPAAPQHVKQARAKISFWFRTLKLGAPGEVRLADVEQAAAKLNLSNGTTDLYVQALKSFLAWCVKNDFLARNPLAKYEKHVSAPTFRRRALTMAEFHRLLAATTDRRALIYTLAILTGMRRGELDSLTVGSVDWEAGKVHLLARCAKNRKEHFFYLPGDFLATLYAFSTGKRMDEKLLAGVSMSHSAETLHRDLLKAGVAVETPEGRVDFHSLRVTFLTLVNELGEDVKSVQTLARHADPRMTFGTYTKAREDRLRAVVDRVHAQLPETNQDIPRLGKSHAGITRAPAAHGTPDFIGLKRVGRASLRADGHLKDIPSQSETFPDINDIKAKTRARFASATNPDIPSQTEPQEESRRRNALVAQIAEALSRVPEADLAILLNAVRGLNRKAGAA